MLALTGFLFLMSCGSSAENQQQRIPEAYKNPFVAPLTQLIEQSPDNPQNYFDRALALAKLQADSLAIVDFYKAIEMDSSNLAYKKAFADFLFEIKNFNQAKHFYEEILNAKPQDPKTELALLQTYINLKDREAARKLWTYMYQAAPKDPAVAYFEAELDLLDQDTAKAIQTLDALLARIPDMYEALFLKGNIYAAQNNVLAVRFYEKAFLLDTLDVLPLEMIGDFFHNNNQFDKALEYYRKAVRYDNTYAYAFYKSGLVYALLDSTDKALNNFDLALQNDVRFIDAYLQKAKLLLSKGRIAEAKMVYETALKFDPNNTEAISGLKKLQST